MRFGMICFVVLFLGTELYRWLLGLGPWELSLPMTLLAGGGLAIASNLPAPTTSSPGAPHTVEPEPTDPSQPLPNTSAPVNQDAIRPDTASQDTISFKIRRPFQAK